MFNNFNGHFANKMLKQAKAKGVVPTSNTRQSTQKLASAASAVFKNKKMKGAGTPQLGNSVLSAVRSRLGK